MWHGVQLGGDVERLVLQDDGAFDFVGDGNAAVELVGDGTRGKACEREEGKAEAKQGVADGHGVSVGW